MAQTRKYKMSAKALESRQQAAKKHGLYAFTERGEEALDPHQVSRLAELRQLAKSRSGRIDLQCELVARSAYIVEIGMAEVVNIHEKKGDVWNSPVIKRLGTFFAELRRALESFPRDTNGRIYDPEIERIQRLIENQDDESD